MLCIISGWKDNHCQISSLADRPCGRGGWEQRKGEGGSPLYSSPIALPLFLPLFFFSFLSLGPLKNDKYAKVLEAATNIAIKLAVIPSEVSLLKILHHQTTTFKSTCLLYIPWEISIDIHFIIETLVNCKARHATKMLMRKPFIDDLASRWAGPLST